MIKKRDAIITEIKDNDGYPYREVMLAPRFSDIKEGDEIYPRTNDKGTDRRLKHKVVGVIDNVYLGDGDEKTADNDLIEALMKATGTKGKLREVAVVIKEHEMKWEEAEKNDEKRV